MASSGSTSSGGELGFGWWQFTGWAGLIVGTLLSLGQYDNLGGLAVFLALVNIGLTVMIIKYSKYAFLVGTVLSFNPVVWIINGIYLRNRWNHPLLMENSRPQGGEAEQAKGRGTETEAMRAPQALPVPMAPISEPVAARNQGQQDVAVTAVSVRSDEDLWADAMAEADSPDRRAGLWAKCFGEARGVESAARAAYMSVRVREMKLAQQAELAAAAAESAAADVRRRAEEQERRLAGLRQEKREMDGVAKGNCPNCDAVIPLEAQECSKCKASFGPGSVWKVIPKT